MKEAYDNYTDKKKGEWRIPTREEWRLSSTVEMNEEVMITIAIGRWLYHKERSSLVHRQRRRLDLDRLDEYLKEELTLIKKKREEDGKKEKKRQKGEGKKERKKGKEKGRKGRGVFVNFVEIKEYKEMSEERYMEIDKNFYESIGQQWSREGSRRRREEEKDRDREGQEEVRKASERRKEREKKDEEKEERAG